MNLELGQIITQIIAFLIMLAVLKRFAWKPLLGIMEDRRNKIKAEFEYIEEQKRDNLKQIDIYNKKLKEIQDQAQVKIQDAINEGQKIADKITEDAKLQAKEIIEKAEEKIEREVEKAKIQLKNDIVNLTLLATQKILHDSLNAEGQKKLITDFVEQADFK